VFLLDRTSDASHNRSVFTLAGEHDAVGDALERLVAASIHEIDMDVHTGEHPRIGAVTSSRSSRWARRRWTTASSSPGLRRAHRDALRPAGLPLRASGHAAERVKLADVRRGSTRDSRARSTSRPCARLRARRMHPRPARSPSGAALPDRVQHQPRLARRRPRQAHRAPRPRVGRWLPYVQANGFWIEELGRAQVSMNLLDFAATPVWLVWDTVRDIAAEDGVALAESELIGLAPLAAFLAVADRADAPPTIRSSAAGRRRCVPAPARLLADAGARAASRRRPGGESRGMTGGPFRIIDGGEATSRRQACS
jgi:hypothetical protein